MITVNTDEYGTQLNWGYAGCRIEYEKFENKFVYFFKKKMVNRNMYVFRRYRHEKYFLNYRARRTVNKNINYTTKWHPQILKLKK